MSEVKTVTVSILDKNYQINCAPGEVEELRQSAEYLDEKMREIKSTASVLGLDRLAVMAALNIAHDFIAQSRQSKDLVDNRETELRSLSSKLDVALDRLKAF